MQIRVSDIPEDGLRVTDAAEFRATFAEEGWNLHRVEILVTRQGTEVGVQGVFEAGAPMVCSRCLEPWVLGVGSSLDVKLCPRPPRSRREEHELGRDDLEVDFYADGILDLGAVMRSEASLALPMKPLCRPDCQGLCPSCGANRNLEPCGCQARRTDSRVAPLEPLRRRP